MRILSSLAFATVLAGLSPALALAEGTISVTGLGTVEVAPDMATVSLGVTTTGTTAGAALAANSQALAAVLAKLKDLGIAPADIQTSNLSLNPNWVSTPEGGSAVEGYQAMNTVTLRIRALEQTGAVLDAAVADGANTLNGLSFGLADSRKAEDEARRLAVADAKARAELLAGAVGTPLGPIVSIVEGGAALPMPGPMYRMDAAASVPVEAGSLGITASVTITWQLQP